MAAVYQGFDVRTYKDKLRKALAKHGLPKAIGVSPSWGRDPDFRVLSQLGYMQPSAAGYWQSFLFKALIAGDVIDRPDIWTITILDKRWHFGERKWDFAPKKIEYQVRRALKGCKRRSQATALNCGMAG
jgi:hypothetical protein